MPLDVFMVIRGEAKEKDDQGMPTKKASESITIQGESLDAIGKPKHAFDVRSFSWGGKHNLVSNTYAPTSTALSKDTGEAEEDSGDDSKLYLEDFEIEKEVD